MRPWLMVLVLTALVSGCGARGGQPTPAAGAPQRVELHYSNGTVQGGVRRVPIKLDNPVQLVVTSDVADEVHVHGYDRKADVAAHGSTTLEFVADQAGVFEVELESRGAQLGQLQVQ
jgi:hypothetical protein